MALADNFRTNLTKNRGIDPRAAATLDAKKNSQAKRQDDLKRKQTEREINTLKSRLTVIDRELQRLSVFERRFHSDVARAKQEFDIEVKNMSELTQELSRHSDKVAELKRALDTKRFSATRMVGQKDFGREAAQKESDRLHNELKRIDREIDQLNSQRRRILSEMSSFQQKAQKASEMEARESTEMRRGENEINQVLHELQSEESLLNRFKTRFSLEKKSVLSKQHELENVKKRLQGAGSGSPGLESEKQKIEKRIAELERTLNQPHE